MMSIDEAIRHARKVAKENRMMCIPGGDEYAKEHEQLADWLEELKRYKAQKFIIKVEPMKANKLKQILRSSRYGVVYPDTQFEIAPLVSSRPDDEERRSRCKETADMLQIILDESASFEYVDADKDMKEGVLVKNVHFEGSFNWVISTAIKILREDAI